MLYLLGLGLWDENDISERAIEIMNACERIYCELFTSAWHGNIESLKKTTGKNIEILSRDEVEKRFPVNEAKNINIALLVPGDPLTATTHFQLLLDAKKNSVPYEIIHASSIYTAVAETGLQLYKFGRTTTLAFPEGNFSPSSPFDVITANKKAGLHTLVLLDINHEKNRYMTALDGIKMLNEKGFADSRLVACCMLGSKNKIIKYGAVSDLANDKELDKSPAAIVIVGEMNFKEEEALELWK